MSKEEKQLSQQVVDMSKEIKKSLTIENGEVTVPKELYVQMLPEDIKEEDVKRLQKHNAVFFPAAAKAVGELAVKEFKSHKDLESVNAGFPLVGRDKFNVGVARERQVRNVATGETSTVYGSLSASLNTHSTRTARGDMHIVASDLKEAALKAYGE